MRIPSSVGCSVSLVSFLFSLAADTSSGSDAQSEFIKGLRHVEGEALERSIAYVKSNLTDDGIETLIVQVMAVMAHAIRYDHQYDGHERPLQPYALRKVAELIAEAKHVGKLRSLLYKLATDEKGTPEERQAAVRMYVRYLLKHAEDAQSEILTLTRRDAAKKDRRYTRSVVQGITEERASAVLLRVLAEKLSQWKELTTGRPEDKVDKFEIDESSEQITCCVFPLAFQSRSMKFYLTDARPLFDPCIRFVRWAGKVREERRPHIQEAKEHILAFLAVCLHQSEVAHNYTPWLERIGQRDGEQGLGLSVVESKHILLTLVQEIGGAKDAVASRNAMSAILSVLSSNGLLPAKLRGGGPATIHVSH